MNAPGNLVEITFRGKPALLDQATQKVALLPEKSRMIETAMDGIIGAIDLETGSIVDLDFHSWSTEE